MKNDDSYESLTVKYTAKPYSYLVNNATPSSDNPLRLRCNLLERI